jgi:hypothetical protein
MINNNIITFSLFNCCLYYYNYYNNNNNFNITINYQMIDNDIDNDNYDDIITCKCGSQFIESDFKYHFHNCNEFNLAYKKLDIDLSTVFKKYSPDHNSLKILKFLLQCYIHLFTKKLHSKYFIPS